MTGRRVLIVGNGIAGRSAALAARQADPGAEICVLGNEGKRTYSPCALPFLLSGSMQKESVLLPALDRSFRIDIRGDIEVSEIDPRGQCVYSIGGACFPYDALILALGGKPRKLFFKDSPAPEGLFHFKTLDDALNVSSRLPRKVAVVGAGLVGIEAAAALVESGVKVTLLEARDQVLPNVLDKKPAQILEGILGRYGLEIITGAVVSEILTAGGRIKGLLTGMGELECDTLIISAGIIPHVELARRSGIEIGSLGAIRVDRSMRTNISNILACGDCAESYDLLLRKTVLHPLWPVARVQGEIAGGNAGGGERSYTGTISMTATNLFGVSIGSMGLSTTSAARELSVEEKRDKRSYRRLLYDGENLVGVQGIGDLHWMSGLKQVIEQKGYQGFSQILSAYCMERP